MFRFWMITLLSLNFFVALSAAGIQLDNTFSGASLTEERADQLAIQFSVDSFEWYAVSTDRGEFSAITVDGFAFSREIGSPRLPILRKVIRVPLGAEVRVETSNIQSQAFTFGADGPEAAVVPAQPSLSKSQRPEDVPFEYNAQAYTRIASSDPVTVEELGIMRGVRLFVVQYNPFVYDPENGILEVRSGLTARLRFEGADHAATEYLYARTRSPFWENVYQTGLLNPPQSLDRDIITQYPVKYVVIADRMFESTLQPFLDWKTEQGFELIVAYTDEIGAGTTEIKSFIQSEYDAGTPESPAPSYVLFVGDVAQIPAWNGNTGNHITDLDYVKMDGNDYFPEIYYSRFSANNVGELVPQIDKTLLYEKFEMSDPSYLGEAVMIAGMDSSHGSTWGNGQINYGTTYYFNDSNGILSHTYLYPESGSNSANIINNVSDGVGYVNYTAHGSQDSWADPSFTIPNINSLQNDEEYPLVVGNCCLTNRFQVQTCFGEAWLRAADKGAIGYIGGTNSTYWDEDFYWGVGAGNVTSNPTYDQTGIGAYDGVFHTHDETVEEWFVTAGAMINCGNLAVVEGNGNYNLYWEIYALMGDGSLSAYMGVPDANAATWDNQIFIGVNTYNVTAEPWSYIGLSMNGQIHGSGIVDESGVLSLDVLPFTVPGDAKLVITAQNKVPVIETIPVIPNEGPYLVCSVIETEDANGMAEYGETFSLRVQVENVGSDPAMLSELTVFSNDPWLTVDDAGPLQVDQNVPAGGSIEIENAFSITVADSIPDMHQALLTFAAEIDEADTDPFITNDFLILHAPEFELDNMSFTEIDGDGNGRVDPGETIHVIFPMLYTGSAELTPDITAILTTDAPLAVIDEPELQLGAYDIDDPAWNLVWEVYIMPQTAPGIEVEFEAVLTAGLYGASGEGSFAVGLDVESFENGFGDNPWAWTDPALPWTIDTSEAWDGNGSARSPDIGHNTETGIEITMDVPVAGFISFYRKVSSENNYDYLRFFVDDTQRGQWAGDQDWAEESYYITAGEHTFRWAYEKDGSVDGGSDCGWIDYVCFPMPEPVDIPIIYVAPDSLHFGDVNVGQTMELSFTIHNLGQLDLVGLVGELPGFEISVDDSRAGTRSAGRPADSRDEVFFVSPGNERVVSVTFTPDEAQDYSGDIVITSNDEFIDETLVHVVAMGEATGAGDTPEVQYVYALRGNSPNPFNPVTEIRFSLKKAGSTTLDIYNIRGQRVRRLYNHDSLEAGEHTIVWDGTDESGNVLGSGMYLYRIKSGTWTATSKMILLK